MSDVTGFVGLGVLIAGNIIAIAYGYGKMCRGLSDLADRVTRIEVFLNGEFKNILGNIHKLEGRIIRLETLVDTKEDSEENSG